MNPISTHQLIVQQIAMSSFAKPHRRGPPTPDMGVTDVTGVTAGRRGPACLPSGGEKPGRARGRKFGRSIFQINAGRSKPPRCQIHSIVPPIPRWRNYSLDMSVHLCHNGIVGIRLRVTRRPFPPTIVTAFRVLVCVQPGTPLGVPSDSRRFLQ